MSTSLALFIINLDIALQISRNLTHKDNIKNKYFWTIYFPSDETLWNILPLLAGGPGQRFRRKAIILEEDWVRVVGGTDRVIGHIQAEVGWDQRHFRLSTVNILSLDGDLVNKRT